MATGKGRPNAYYRGAAGAQKADEELARQKAQAELRKAQGDMPFRFRIKEGEENVEFVVVDDAPDFYRFEHNLKNPRTDIWDIYTGCTKEWDNCPVCQTAERESYYALYLTVIDFSEFKTRDGTKHTFSRKLLVVKPAQQKKFQRAYAKAQKDGLSLRGAIFSATRDGPKDSAIGNDIEFVDYMSEEDMASYVRTWKDKEGKKHTENCSEVYDYEALFEVPTTEALAEIVGAGPSPGSRAHADAALGRARPSARRGAAPADDDDYEEPARNSRMPARRSAAPAEEEEEAPAPRRGRTAAPEEPAPRPARAGSRARVAEPEDEDADADEAPPPRTARGAPRREEAPARTTRRPIARAAAEPDYDEDDAPAPGVGRRVSLRGR